MKVSAQKLAEMYGKERRTVTNWLNETPPCPSVLRGRVREFDTVAVAEWHATRAVRQARTLWERERPQEDEVKRARDRRTVMETRIVELQLETAEGSVVPLDVHEQRVTALCERLAAAVKTSGKYVGDVQNAVTAVEAAAVLERITDDTLAALRATADDIDSDAPSDSAEEAA